MGHYSVPNKILSSWLYWSVTVPFSVKWSVTGKLLQTLGVWLWPQKGSVDCEGRWPSYLVEHRSCVGGGGGGGGFLWSDSLLPSYFLSACFPAQTSVCWPHALSQTRRPQTLHKDAALQLSVEVNIASLFLSSTILDGWLVGWLVGSLLVDSCPSQLSSVCQGQVCWDSSVS